MDLLQRANNFIPVNSLKMIYNALIQPYFDYCSPLWDISGTQSLDKLQKFKNRAARIIAGASYEIDSAVVLETLGWETLKSRKQKMQSILLYKILNDYTTPNLKDMRTRTMCEKIKAKCVRYHDIIWQGV